MGASVFLRRVLLDYLKAPVALRFPLEMISFSSSKRALSLSNMVSCFELLDCVLEK